MVASRDCGWSRAYTSREAATTGGIAHSHARIDSIGPAYGPVPDSQDQQEAKETIRSDAKRVTRLIRRERADYQTLVDEVNRVLPMVAEHAAIRAEEVPRTVRFQGSAQPRDKVIEHDAAGRIVRIVET